MFKKGQDAGDKMYDTLAIGVVALIIIVTIAYFFLSGVNKDQTKEQDTKDKVELVVNNSGVSGDLEKLAKGEETGVTDLKGIKEGLEELVKKTKKGGELTSKDKKVLLEYSKVLSDYEVKKEEQEKDYTRIKELIEQLSNNMG